MENLTPANTPAELVDVPQDGEQVCAVAAGPNKGPVRPGFQKLLNKIWCVFNGRVALRAVVVDHTQTGQLANGADGAISATGAIVSLVGVLAPLGQLVQVVADRLNLSVAATGQGTVAPTATIPEGELRSDGVLFARVVCTGNVGDGASCFRRGSNIQSAVRVSAGIYEITTKNCPAAYLGLADGTAVGDLAVTVTRQISGVAGAEGGYGCYSAVKTGAAGDPVSSKIKITVHIRRHSDGALNGDGLFAVKCWV